MRLYRHGLKGIPSKFYEKAGFPKYLLTAFRDGIYCKFSRTRFKIHCILDYNDTFETTADRLELSHEQAPRLIAIKWCIQAAATATVDP